MTTDALKEKRLALIGAGTENEALAVYLAGRGIRFSVCDAQASRATTGQPWNEAVDAWHLGEDYLDYLDKYELVFRTPGISPLHPAMRKATSCGVEVSSQTRLFFERCPAPILAVTGTKGKGTTVSAIVEMLKAGPHDRVWLGGNIGTPPIQYVDDVSAEEIVVLELSSFQLQDLNVSPHIAVMLNLFDDHLDYHEDGAEYLEAKRTISAFQGAEDHLVLNRDSPQAMSFLRGSSARASFFSIAGEVDEGCFVADGSLWLRLSGKREKICAVGDVPLLGAHNLANVAAASAAAAAAGASVEAIGSGIGNISSLPHRLQLVATIDGVSYYNDSLATVPEAALAAVRAFREPVHLIAGGSSKGADFSSLAKGIVEVGVVRSVALIGDEAGRIITALDTAGFDGDVITFDRFEDCVAAMADRAQPGEVLLLAPACASFGMFENYAERGREFSRLVEERRKP